MSLRRAIKGLCIRVTSGGGCGVLWDRFHIKRKKKCEYVFTAAVTAQGGGLNVITFIPNIFPILLHKKMGQGVQNKIHHIPP